MYISSKIAPSVGRCAPGLSGDHGRDGHASGERSPLRGEEEAGPGRGLLGPSAGLDLRLDGGVCFTITPWTAWFCVLFHVYVVFYEF